MKINNRHTSAFTLLALAICLFSTAAHAEPKTFTLDQNQSKLYFTGDVSNPSLGSGPITEQSSGSLTSSYTGTIEVNLDGLLIQFVGGSIIDGTVTGNWQPGVGGTPGVTAPADYGGKAKIGTFIVVNAMAAIRETRFDVTNVSATISAGTFPVSGLRIFSPNTNLFGLMDYSYTGFASGSGQKPLAAVHTNAIANGTLVTQGAELVLTIPVDISGTVPAGGGTIINYRFRGNLVAKAPAPIMPLLITSFHLVTNQATLKIDTTPGQSFSILGSTNLTGWTTTNDQFVAWATNTTRTFSVPPPAVTPQQYFRVRKN